MKSNSVLLAAGAMLLSGAAASQTQTQRVVVPAFFPLNSFNPYRGFDWTRIQNSGSAVQIVVADYNVLSGDIGGAQQQFNALRNAGQIVLGYVDSATYNGVFNEVLRRRPERRKHLAGGLREQQRWGLLR